MKEAYINRIPQLRDARVFPLKDDTKKPLGNWDTAYNGETNYAVHTGDSGLIVIDLDVHDTDGLAEFKNLFGELPDTFTVDTPSGGKHLYFLNNAGIGRHPKLWDGIDILGGAGYVVGPGSMIDGAEYTVSNNREIEPLPTWLRDKIQEKLAAPITPGWSSDLRTGLPTLDDLAAEVASAGNGERNLTLLSNARTAFLSPRFADSEAWEILTSAATEVGLPADEIQATLNSAYRFASEHRSHGPGPVARADDTTTGWEPWNPDDWYTNGRAELETVCRVHGGDFGLFYVGKTNTVIAESEAGKSWLGLRACADEINEGRAVAYIDFEDSGEEIYERLLLMTDWEAVKELFRYFRPETPMPGDFVGTHIQGRSLVIIDGYGEALALHGLKQDDEGVLKFNRNVSRPMSLTGAAVVHLDHFPKDTNNQKNAFGSVYKKNTVSGASYFLRNKEAFGKGQSGYSVLEVAKDRPGQIRQHCEKNGSDYYAAELRIDGTAETSVRVVYPSLSNFVASVDYKQRVSDYMEQWRTATKTDVRKGVKGNNEALWAATEELIRDGFLKAEGRSIGFVKPWKPPF